jgi:hypothetical protein
MPNKASKKHLYRFLEGEFGKNSLREVFQTLFLAKTLSKSPVSTKMLA